MPLPAATRNFYPRSPCGERRCPPVGKRLRSTYFYPRSPCGERLTDVSYLSIDNSISIHALLAESDDRQRKRHPHPLDFYPRSPCGERQLAFLAINPITKFLSTLSLRRATPAIVVVILPPLVFLSTLSLRRATGISTIFVGFSRDFYPRSPCGERRPMPCPSRGRNRNFYPRSPCGERPA